MRKVFKYYVDQFEGLMEPVTVEMPAGAKLLSIQTQNGRGCLWAEVEMTAPIRKRAFMIVGTGHEIPALCGGYVGTYQVGHFVWHVYEVLA